MDAGTVKDNVGPIEPPKEKTVAWVCVHVAR